MLNFLLIGWCCLTWFIDVSLLNNKVQWLYTWFYQFRSFKWDESLLICFNEWQTGWQGRFHPAIKANGKSITSINIKTYKNNTIRKKHVLVFLRFNNEESRWQTIIKYSTPYCNSPRPLLITRALCSEHKRKNTKKNI